MLGIVPGGFLRKQRKIGESLFGTTRSVHRPGVVCVCRETRRVKKLLALPRRAEICMVVSAGKRTAKGVYGERFRFARDTFYQIR